MSGVNIPVDSMTDIQVDETLQSICEALVEVNDKREVLSTLIEYYLDCPDMEDFFGTEGWRHALLGEE